jgi:hypothetical protein
MWNYEMEREWCTWAEKSADSKLFESLLFIAEPQSWSHHDALNSIWQSKKDEHGYYHLEAEPPSFTVKKKPSMASLLAIAKYANQEGRMSWVLANRIIGRRIDHRGAVLPMAILIGLKVIAPQEHWQRGHKVDVGLSQVISILSNELHDQGALSWNSQSASFLKNTIRESLSNNHLGWLEFYDKNTILEIIESDYEGEELTLLPNTEAGLQSGLDKVLADFKETRANEKLQEVLENFMNL